MTQSTLVSVKKYTIVFVVLLLLLVITYVLAHIDLGRFNIATSLFIAAIKASLVLLYFMHLRSSVGILRVAAGVGAFWLSIMVFLTMTDYLSRDWLMLPSLWP